MTRLGAVELVAVRDFCTEERTNVPSLFSVAERSKELRLLEDVERGAPLRVTIDRFGSFETLAEATAKKGERVPVWSLVPQADLLKALVASGDIRQGEKLRVTYEAI